MTWSRLFKILSIKAPITRDCVYVHAFMCGCVHLCSLEDKNSFPVSMCKSWDLLWGKWQNVSAKDLLCFEGMWRRLFDFMFFSDSGSPWSLFKKKKKGLKCNLFLWFITDKCVLIKYLNSFSQHLAMCSKRKVLDYPHTCFQCVGKMMDKWKLFGRIQMPKKKGLTYARNS